MLQDTGHQLGVATAISEYVSGDIASEARADPAGATPMDMRFDASLTATPTVVELERLAIAAGYGTVRTAAELALVPGSSMSYRVTLVSPRTVAEPTPGRERSGDLAAFPRQASRARGGGRSTASDCEFR